MTRVVSVYLDLLRVSAAFIVLVYHFSYQRFTSDLYPMYFGHEAVIVFLILSGYVIAFVADTKEDNIKKYLVSRFSRLYSVVLPALILVPIIDYIGMSYDLLVYEGKVQDSYFLIRFLANLTFTQEIWFFSIRYLSDGPLWSLGYEFWYYVLFAIICFIQGYKKYLFLSVISLLIGPKILLLLPIWILGASIYNFHVNHSLSRLVSRVLFVISPVIFLMLFGFYSDINFYVYQLLGDSLNKKLGFSAGFVTDYIAGVLFGINILCFKFTQFKIVDGTLIYCEKLIRYLANSTFAIYIFHFPILLFYSAVLKHNNNSILDIVLLFSLTLISCFIISAFTEKKKYVFKKYIGAVADWMEDKYKK